MNFIKVQKRLKETGMVIFTTLEFQRLMGMSTTASRKFLLHYTRLGIFWQIKRGLYSLRFDELHPWLVANKLYQPSYISLDTALSYYGLIPETIFEVTCITTRATREFEACNLIFHYHTIKKQAYTGYDPKIIDNNTILLATPEKAIADYLYFAHLGKVSWNDRIRFKGLHKQQLKYHLKLFGRKHLLKWSQNVIGNKS